MLKRVLLEMYFVYYYKLKIGYGLWTICKAEHSKVQSV